MSHRFWRPQMRSEFSKDGPWGSCTGGGGRHHYEDPRLLTTAYMLEHIQRSPLLSIFKGLPKFQREVCFVGELFSCLSAVDGFSVARGVASVNLYTEQQNITLEICISIDCPQYYAIPQTSSRATIAPLSKALIQAALVCQSLYRKKAGCDQKSSKLDSQNTQRTNCYEAWLLVSMKIDWPARSYYHRLFLGPLPHILVGLKSAHTWAIEIKKRNKKRKTIDGIQGLQKILDLSSELHRGRDIEQLKKHVLDVDALIAENESSLAHEVATPHNPKPTLVDDENYAYIDEELDEGPIQSEAEHHSVQDIVEEPVVVMTGGYSPKQERLTLVFQLFKSLLRMLGQARADLEAIDGAEKLTACAAELSQATFPRGADLSSAQIMQNARARRWFTGVCRPLADGTPDHDDELRPSTLPPDQLSHGHLTALIPPHLTLFAIPISKSTLRRRPLIAHSSPTQRQQHLPTGQSAIPDFTNVDVIEHGFRLGHE
ncbi:hypothetical protein HYPSUDRAFT_56491 [Hypholoma sublateritium FD-334 SS-4]|uniref:Uncharacterized protein n=1 Tax=Hypholoma sublateritium (strain FD-334 SS-4) TaxID=945553 RepID=A0A0D2M8Y8_HYPSF|nr:hypothetical protein HYPSUDRAFT_56491 [Hypholoma sublateritium FD-334 SS-4]